MRQLGDETVFETTSSEREQNPSRVQLTLEAALRALSA